MRTTELLLICDGKIRAEHRGDYARAIDHDPERSSTILGSQLDRKSPAMGAGLGDTKEMQAGDTAGQSLCLTGSLVLRRFDPTKSSAFGGT